MVRVYGAAVERREHARMASGSFRLKVSTTSLAFLIIFSVFALAMLYLVQYSEVGVTRYDIGELKAKQAALVAENDALDFQLAQLQSPRRIDETARKKLGMILQRAHFVSQSIKAEAK